MRTRQLAGAAVAASALCAGFLAVRRPHLLVLPSKLVLVSASLS